MRTPAEAAAHMQKQRGLEKAREWAHLHAQGTDNVTAREYWREVARILDAKETPQERLDRIYREGKAAYQKFVGTHGPTVRHLFGPKAIRPDNPYPYGTKDYAAWQRGFNQDVRRTE